MHHEGATRAPRMMNSFYARLKDSLICMLCYRVKLVVNPACPLVPLDSAFYLSHSLMLPSAYFYLVARGVIISQTSGLNSNRG